MSKFEGTPTASKATLAHLIELLEAHPTLTEITRKDMICALRTLARVLKTEPHLLPAKPAELRVLINNALPAATGMVGGPLAQCSEPCSAFSGAVRSGGDAGAFEGGAAAGMVGPAGPAGG